MAGEETKTKTRFTPGPWHRNVKPGRKYPVVFAGRNNHVARVDTTGKTDAEIEANIDLVVAAPDLYKALSSELETVLLWRQEIARETTGADRVPGILKDIQEGLAISAEKLERALALARGGE